jgi:hypothetical protein
VVLTLLRKISTAEPVACTTWATPRMVRRSTRSATSPPGRVKMAMGTNTERPA